jgi:hypothetical protein
MLSRFIKIKQPSRYSNKPKSRGELSKEIGASNVCAGMYSNVGGALAIWFSGHIFVGTIAYLGDYFLDNF